MTDIRMRTAHRFANLQRSAQTRTQTRASWFRIIRNEAGTGPSRVDLYDDIGGGGWFGGGISAQDFVGQLADIDGDLEVHINSGGGDVFDGIAIYNAIANRSGATTVIVDGIAASIASVIAQAGTTRVIAPGAMMMIHDALSMCIGNAADMRETADLLDQVSDNLASVYASRGGTTAAWREAMQAETWYNADQAVAAGLADKLADRPADPADVAAHDFSMFARVPRWLRNADGDDDGQDEDEGQTCRTCQGKGRLPHPKTGKNSQKCPGCNGTGKVPTGDGDEPEGTEDRSGRVLGIESMPMADKALPVHHTATVDTPWDGPAAVKAMPNDDTVLKYCHAWESAEAAATPHRDGDDDADDKKTNYKFPHHDGKGAPANVAACNNGLARLAGADIPDADRAGVEAHLRAHLKDAGHGDDADDHAHRDLSAAAFAPEQFATALKEAFK